MIEGDEPLLMPGLMRLAILAAAVLVLSSRAHGFQQPGREPLPDFDLRQTQQLSGQKPSSERALAETALRLWVPDVKVDFDPLSGSPRSIASTTGFLTGPSGEGKGISPATLAKVRPDDPQRAIKTFMAERRQLFGFGPEVLDSARIARDYVTAHNGMRTVVWEQQVQGIRIYDTVLVANTTGSGELINVTSLFIPHPDQAAATGTPDSKALLVQPTVSARDAIVLAAQNIGVTLKEQDLAPIGTSEAGPEQRQLFRGPGLKGEAEAKFMWFATDKNTLRLCWDVIVMSRQRGEMYRILVDANNAQLLRRQCLTRYISNASYRVWTSDSPSPMSPGYPTPVTNQPPLASRTLLTLAALDTNASPAGWIPDGGNETLGNNVDAHTDWNSDNLPDLPRPQGSPFRVFDISINLAKDPTNYASGSVVQLFYLCNYYHDVLYQLGFTEAAGNFQSNNFGRGGLGNDAVQADAQDGGGLNNANFSTPPDGSPGRMQMYIFNGPTPRRDGDLDAEVVFHEHTHGVSWRLVGGGQMLGTTQSDGMGEGWSDFYALSLLSQAGDDVNGNYGEGAYVSYKLNSSAFLQNYYFGIRRYPYTTDMSKNPLTFKDIDPAQADFCSSSAPFSPSAGTCNSANASEVHNEGEVWCVTLWEARANLINKYGWAVGNQLMLQLVTDGMKLTPAHPNFLQARDAIIQADLVDTGGANRNELWAAFAKRGMGLSAISASSTTTSHIHEAFDIPPSGLIAYYPFSGTPNDASGYGHNGTNSGAILTTDRFGGTNLAYHFNGTSSVISVAPSPSFELTTNITIAAWVRRASSGRNDPILCKDKNQPGGTSNFTFRFDPNDRLAFWFWVSGWYGGESASILTDPNWHQVAVTYDGQQISFYIDGRGAGTVAETTPMLPQNEPLQIGQDQSVGPPFASFSGDLDEVALFNRALSPSEVQALYGLAISNARYMSGTFTVTVWTTAGQTFYLESTDSLPPVSWVGRASIIGDGAAHELTDASASAPQRFYRVRAQ